jgi:hypothetical protein
VVAEVPEPWTVHEPHEPPRSIFIVTAGHRRPKGRTATLPAPPWTSCLIASISSSVGDTAGQPQLELLPSSFHKAERTRGSPGSLRQFRSSAGRCRVPDSMFSLLPGPGSTPLNGDSMSPANVVCLDTPRQEEQP